MPSSAAKKLIEVALPLDAINRASAREKSIRHGHPSTLHLMGRPGIKGLRAGIQDEISSTSPAARLVGVVGTSSTP